MIESRVVAIGEGDHDVARLLRNLVVRDVVLSQHLRAHQRGLVSQIGLAVLVTSCEVRIGHLLQPSAHLRRHRVPRFGCAKM